MSAKITCKRCGACCYYQFDGKYYRCKHLIRFRTGSTACRTYKTRLGKVIAHNERKKGQYQICIRSEESKYNYVGCPYNKEGREMNHDMEKYYETH